MKIIHISDLHFGAEFADRVKILANDIRAEKPDLVIASGDLTQRGRKEEFIAARAFLDSLGIEWLAIPGNHDLPRRNLVQRFIDPFYRFRTYIHPQPDRILRNDAVCIAAVNSARAAVPHWNWANGAVSDRQIDEIDRAFDECPKGVQKILVVHHPLFRIPSSPLKTVVWGSSALIRLIQHQPGLLILTGHTHAGSLCRMENGAVLVAAPSACSHRLRNQENGYNLVFAGKDATTVRQKTYYPAIGRFLAQSVLEIHPIPHDDKAQSADTPDTSRVMRDIISEEKAAAETKDNVPSVQDLPRHDAPQTPAPEIRKA